MEIDPYDSTLSNKPSSVITDTSHKSYQGGWQTREEEEEQGRNEKGRRGGKRGRVERGDGRG